MGGGGGEQGSIICSFSKPGPGALVLIYYLLLVVEVIRVRACETKAPIVDPFWGSERQTDRQTATSSLPFACAFRVFTPG